MKRGISPIISVVLLIAVAVVAAVGLYFWAGGLATNQPTPATPIAITAVPLDNTAGQLKLLVANLGGSGIPAGTELLTSNGGNVTLDDALPAGQQALVTFWGGSDGSTTTEFTSGNVVVYGSNVSAVEVPVTADEPIKKGPCNVTDDAGDDIAPSIIQAGNGKYYAVWSSNRDGDYDLWMANATGLCNWSGEVQVNNDAGSQTNPNLIQANDGTFYIAYQSNENGNNEVYVINSTDYGVTWSSAVNVSANAAEDTFPHMLQNSSGGFMVAWNTDVDDGGSIYWANSSNGWDWSAGAELIDVSSSNGLETIGYSLIENDEGEYMGLLSHFSPNLFVCLPGRSNHAFSFTNTTGSQKNIGAGAVCSYDSFGKGDAIQDDEGRYIGVIDGAKYDGAISLWISEDANTFYQTKVTNSSSVERYPSLIQASDDRYVLAYSTDKDGNNNIYARATSDPMLW